MTDRLRAALDDFAKELSPTERQLLPYNQATPDGEDVLKVAEEISKTTNKRRSRSAGIKFASFLESIQQFSGVVDTFVQSNPQISGLIWSGIKCLMQVVCSYADYFDKISDIYQKLGSVCPRLAKFQKLFPQSQGLQDAVVDFYTTITHICTRTVIFLKSSAAKQIFKSIWKPFKLEFKEIEENLLVQRDVIDQEIRLASEMEARAGRQQACAYQNQGIQHRLFEIKQWDGLNLRLNLQEQKTKRELLLMSICAYDHVSEFLRLSEKQIDKSASLDWFLGLPTYRSWFDSSNSKVLWCHGIPGSGKSVLMTRMLDHLLATRKANTFISYFFCTYADQESLDLRVILGSILKQILIILGRWPVSLEKSIEKALSDSMGKLALSSLKDILIEAVKLLPKIYIVIDGIDECSSNVQSTLLKFLMKLHAAHNDFKTVISSRTDVEVTKIVEVVELNLNLVENRSDIADFVKISLKEKIEERKIIPLDDGLLEEVKTALTSGAKGMFLWVDLQIHDICRQHNKEDIRKLLQSLPKDLDKTYERILNRILDEKLAPVALKIFKWLFVAKWPLRMSELAEAIALEATDKQYFQLRSRLPDDTLKMIHNCGNLVIVSEVDSTVQFAHFTVKEMLDKASCKIEQLRSPKLSMFELDVGLANSDVGCLCMSYLRFSDFERQMFKRPGERPGKPPGMSQGDAIAEVSSGIGSTGSWMAVILNSASTSGWLWPWKLVAFAMDSMHIGRQTADFVPSLPPAEAPESVFVSLKVQYALLEYIAKNWLSHCTHLKGGPPAEETFRNLILGPGPPFPYLPWGKYKSDGPVNMPHLAPFRWCVEEDQALLLAKMIRGISSKELTTLLGYRLQVASGTFNLVNCIFKNRRTEVLRLLARTESFKSIIYDHRHNIVLYFLSAVADGALTFAYEIDNSGFLGYTPFSFGECADRSSLLGKSLRVILDEGDNGWHEELFPIVIGSYENAAKPWKDMEAILDLKMRTTGRNRGPEPSSVLKLLHLYPYSDDTLALLFRWTVRLQIHPIGRELREETEILQRYLSNNPTIVRLAIRKDFENGQGALIGDLEVNFGSLLEGYSAYMDPVNYGIALDSLVSNPNCGNSLLRQFVVKASSDEINKLLFRVISSDDAAVKLGRLVNAGVRCDCAHINGVSALKHAKSKGVDNGIILQLIRGGAT